MLFNETRYTAAMEIAKATGDYVWFAGAVEAHFCASVLLAIAKCRETGENKELTQLIMGANSTCQEVLLSYEKADAYFLRVSSCLRVARWFCELWNYMYRPDDLHPFSKYKSEVKLDEGGPVSGSQESKTSILEANQQEGFSPRVAPIQENGTAVLSKTDASSLTMKVWESGVEFLRLDDQVSFCANASFQRYRSASSAPWHPILLLSATIESMPSFCAKRHCCCSPTRSKTRKLSVPMASHLPARSLPWPG